MNLTDRLLELEDMIGRDSLTLAGGYTVIKPYFSPSGEMFFDFGTSRDFVPVELNENGHITDGVFYERISCFGM